MHDANVERSAYEKYHRQHETTHGEVLALMCKHFRCFIVLFLTISFAGRMSPAIMPVPVPVPVCSTYIRIVTWLFEGGCCTATALRSAKHRAFNLVLWNVAQLQLTALTMLNGYIDRYLRIM